ncbi:MAG: hypothetical protein IGS48_14850 [Oscillatoriales cyanobacterium C42_A2020_001]|nr:hypothetical protein [Leptolyngbyaceae cyanobacterium C42_A2020_001]
MLPLVLNEHQVHLFNFYLDGEIHLGMRHGVSLFGLVNTFAVSQRSEAYQCANKLAQAGRSVSITVSRQHYKVWIRLAASEELPGNGLRAYF